MTSRSYSASMYPHRLRLKDRAERLDALIVANAPRLIILGEIALVIRSLDAVMEELGVTQEDADEAYRSYLDFVEEE